MSISRFHKQKLSHKVEKSPEGYELQVLAGATNFLEERKIAMILSEVGFRPSDFRHTFFTKIYDKLY
ncbi:MAG: hypothetical protein EWV55_11830 [Microcystis viridis Mv_BB_P_19951000_S69]|uniref:Uncharacterized protein n=2 Tax=Microcystis TaxID=1125 RepID=A0A552HR80_MICVR|nr:hypothetical protein GQR42_03780 [Microcystis aeruginosa FD4]TRU72512.1 MAG: hypothetical protein EWV47_15040 [Microcystis viridis Mv_BB_P_19951000_S68]TRU73732.1 MAG: hypothetical protein EWV77_11250 [Microcystis viridis Mv_BB_P_19951000_S68D]TRU73984.1 MAG: hypothetical protein EWV55_11830 [Microcystis viridis Mv_BB_P_19951000_S69]TRU83407.1 MAG: hypothetical protein EWV46_16690 [Microcystis viridis Mv_BB_P_19951000_S69D]